MSGVSRLPRCVICDRSCIPLADYDAPTCIDCDDAMRMVTITARLSTELPTPPVAEPLPLQLDRPLHTYYGPAPAEVLEQLVDALFPPAKPRQRRPPVSTKSRELSGAAA